VPSLNVSRSSLKDYIESRGLKELARSMGKAVESLANKEVDNIVLICPFEEESAEHKKVS